MSPPWSSARSRRLAALAVLAAAMPALADVIALNNGDRITGTIAQITPTAVEVATTYGGKITLQRGAIRSLASDHAVSIVNDAGASHTAFVGPTAGNTGWAEVAAAAPDPAAIAVPYVAAAPAAPPAPPAPESVFGPNWKAQLVLSLVNLAGNTNQTEFSGEASFHYQNKPDELTLKFDGAYGTTNGTTDNSQVSADAVYRHELLDWKPADRWFMYGESHELYDGIRHISLRSIDGVGLGFYAWRGQKLAVDFRAGPGMIYERFFSGHTTTDFAGMVGMRATYKFNERVGLTEEALYDTALSETTRWQASSETALDVKMPEVCRGLGLKVGFRDDYDNTAAGGLKRNDTRFVVGLALDY